MAIDEAIAEAVAETTSPATLRFYYWTRPTLSLGYFQSFADAAVWDPEHVDVVRRSTGGGAIMHHHELTYSLTLPSSDNDLGARQSAYRGLHDCIRETLAAVGVKTTPFRETVGAVAGRTDAAKTQSKGLAGKRNEPFLCFQRRTDEDLICGGYKILGSAQRRVRGGILQHGSLLLRTSTHADPLPGILELTDTRLDPAEIASEMVARIGRSMSIDFRPGELSGNEHCASELIANQRYASETWTHRR